MATLNFDNGTVTFSDAGLGGETSSSPTAMMFAKSGEPVLFVAQLDGTIKRYVVEKQIDGTFEVSNSKTPNQTGDPTINITIIKDTVENYDETGNIATGSQTDQRQITGLVTTVEEIDGVEYDVVYVSSSDRRHGGGGGASDKGVDANSGQISKIILDKFSGSVVDSYAVIRGLPRSAENHSTNGIDLTLDDNGNVIMYIAQGGNTNKGAPSNNFVGFIDSSLSGTILKVNLTELEAYDVRTGANGEKFILDLPTINDPGREDVDLSTLDIQNLQADPLFSMDIAPGTAPEWAGSSDAGNGTNSAKITSHVLVSENGQLKLVANPMSVFQPGYRNQYDVHVTENGEVVSWDNGPNGGWGGQAVPLVDQGGSENYVEEWTKELATNDFNEAGSGTFGDWLHVGGKVSDEFGPYAGDANPIRAAVEALALAFKQDQPLYVEVDGELVINTDVYAHADLSAPILDYDGSTVLFTDFEQALNFLSRLTPHYDKQSDGSWLDVRPEGPASPQGAALKLMPIDLHTIVAGYDWEHPGSSLSDPENHFSGTGIGDGTAFSPEAELLSPGQDGGLIQGGTSSNGLSEYTASGWFGGALEGAIIGTAFGGAKLQFVELLDTNSDGRTDAANEIGTISSFGSQPLSVQALGDNGLGPTLIDNDNDGVDDFSGVIFAVTYGANNITTFVPGGTPTDPSVDADGDGINDTQDTHAWGADNGKGVMIGSFFGPLEARWDMELSSSAVPFGVNTNVGPAPDAGIVAAWKNGVDAARDSAGKPRDGLLYDGDNFDIGGASSFLSIGTAPVGTAEGEANNQKDALAVGAILSPSLASATITAEMLNIFDYQLNADNNVSWDGGEKVGIYVGPDQSTFMHAAVVVQPDGTAELEIYAETNDGNAQVQTVALTGIDAPLDQENQDSVVQIGFEIDLQENTAIARARYQNPNLDGDPSTADADWSQWFETGSVTIPPAVSASLYGNHANFSNEVGATVGMFANAPASDDSFAASWDWVEIVGTPKEQVEGEVLYRWNAGNQGNVTAIDGGPDWVTSTAPIVAGSTNKISTHNITDLDPSVPADTTPTGIFAQERWDEAAGDEFELSFNTTTTGTLVPVGEYAVRIFLGNGYSGTSAVGQRVFDVSVEGQLVADDLDPVDQWGHATGGMIEWTGMVNDGSIDIAFQRMVENPQINAVEILALSGGGGDPVPVVSILGGTFGEADGSTGVTIETDAPVPADETVTVTWEVRAVSEGATPEIDFTVPGGSFISHTGDGVYQGQSEIAGGSSDVTIPITVIDDTDVEGAELFEVVITNVSGANATIGTGTATVTIADNDVATGTAIYRINAGGEEVTATDGGIAWAEDQSADTGGTSVANGNAQAGTPSPHLVASITDQAYGANFSGTNSTNLDTSIFTTERFGQINAAVEGDVTLAYDFAVGSGDYIVNLYFAEVWTGANTPGKRVFDVHIEGELAFDDIDLTADYGFNNVGVASYEVNVTDGTLDLDFLKGPANNPKVSAVEVIQVGEVSIDAVVSVGAPTPASQVENGGDGSVTTLTFPVTFDAAPSADVTIDYTVDISGTQTTGSLTLGQTDGQISVDVPNDDLANGAESVTVTITGVSSGPATIGTASAVGEVTEDDQPVTQPGTVLFRVNVGGPEVAATDGGPAWGQDQGNFGHASNSPYLTANSTGTSTYNGNSASAHDGAVDVTDASIPDGTPAAIFNTERYDADAAPEQQWQFPVAAEGLLPGDQVEVRLYFAELFSGVDAAGERVFDVEVEGTVPTAFDDIDPFAAAGAKGAFMRSAVVTIDSDGTLDLTLVHGIENPALKGIEVLKALEVQNAAPTVSLSPATLSLPEDTDTTAGTLKVADIVVADDGIGTNDLSLSGADAAAFVIVDGASGPELHLNQDVALDFETKTAFDVNVDVDDTTIGTTPDDTASFTLAIDDVIETPADAALGIEVGDFSEAFDAPTGINLAAGANSILATQAGDGDGRDFDFIKVVVPEGHALTGITLDSFSDYDDTVDNGTFIGIAAGETFPFPFGTDQVDSTQLLGGHVVFEGEVGEDLFAEFADGTVSGGGNAPTQSFETLGAGSYVLGFSQNQATATTGLNLTVEPVTTTETIKVWAPNANGHFVFEAESAVDQDLPGGWEFHTTADLPDGHAAPTGGGYIEAASNSFSSPKNPDASPNSILTYDFVPEADGFIRVNLVASHQGNSTEENDTWTGVLDKDGNPINAIDQGGQTLQKQGALELYKTFSSGGGGNQWVTANKNIDNVGKAIVVPVTAGELHQLVLMERSAEHEVDRIVLEFSTTPFGAPNSNTGSHIDQPLSSQVDFEVEIDPVDPDAVGSATLGVTLNSDNVQISNYSANSFQITNTGGKVITTIEIDVSNALYPDSVFDPFGVAGDSTAKALTIDAAGGTGVQPITSANYIGEGGIKGYEGITLDFSNFDPGETIGFSIDMDANSIAGSTKSTLDDGASPAWDVGGVSGAELIGSNFTVTFADGTTATGQLQGNDNQGGAQALATQSAVPPPEVTLTVNGLNEGNVGLYNVAPSVVVNGPIGATARVVLTKGVIQPENNNFSGDYADQLQGQLDALADSAFPANNAAEFQTIDIVLTGQDQDITSMFDFTEVPNDGFAMDEDKFPLGFVASVIDPANNDLPVGPVTAPIYLTYSESLLPVVTLTAPEPVLEGGDSGVTEVVFTAAVNDPTFTGVVDVTYDETVNGTPARKTATLDFGGAEAPTLTVSVANDNAGDRDDTVSLALVSTTSTDAVISTAAVATTVTEDDAGPVEGDVVLRINAFGPELTATDGGPNWVVDTPFYSAIDDRGDTLLTATAGDSGAPDELFQQTRSADGSMAFAIDAGEHLKGNGLYKVKLYFTEPHFGGADNRVFDTQIEGVVFDNLDNLDPAAVSAKGVGFVIENIVEVSDGVLNIEPLSGLQSGPGAKQNPVISGIEIIEMVTVPDGNVISVETADVTELADEGTTPVTYTLVASEAGFTGVVELTYETTVGGATTTTTETFDFAAGAPTIIVDVLNDDLDNGAEEVTLKLLSTTTADVSVDDTAQTAAVLEDDVDFTQVEGGSAVIGITESGGLNASTFNGSSFTITNNSVDGVMIEKVVFDLSSGILPDMVFDPFGSGGDETAKPLQVNSGGAATGFVTPASPEAPFSQPRNGGWDVMDLSFTDFDPGETIAFAVDVDPNSIQDGAGAGFAGAVSGAELIGSTITVTFTDGTSTETTMGSLFENGTLGGGVSLNSSGDAPATPTLALRGPNPDEVDTLPGQQTTVAELDQTIVVTGAVGATVHLVQLDGRLLENSSVPAFDVTDVEKPFYANELMEGKQVFTGTIDTDGTAAFDVTLLATAGTPEGGINHFMAVLEDPATGVRSMASMPLVLKHGTPVNHLPTITGDTVGEVVEDGMSTAAGTLTVADLDTGESATQPQTGTVGSYGMFDITAEGAWTYTLDNNNGAVQALAAGDTLTETFTVTSADGSASEDVTVTIVGTNDTPTITGETLGNVTEDGTQIATGMLIIADTDSGESIAQPQTGTVGSYGTFDITGAGAWTYTLNNADASVQALGAGDTLNDTFTVLSADGSATEDVTVTIRGNAVQIGGPQPDRLSGGNGDDVLSGGNGNDILSGRGGNDILIGGRGDDIGSGGDGDDVGRGDLGNDVFAGGYGNDNLFGGSGNDTLNGGEGDDTLNGGAGDDQLIGQFGNDILRGENGNDLLFGGSGMDTLLGGHGNDTARGGLDADAISMGGGNDLAEAGEGNDTVSGGAGHDTLSGGEGFDLLVGDAGNDLIIGGGANDVLLGGAGHDELRGESGADRLSGGTGNDLLLGGDSNDTLRGEDGNDTLLGGRGNDHLFGGAGIDTLNGGDGNDNLFGGEARDVFVLSVSSGGLDNILDFNDDLIAIEGATFEDLSFADGRILHDGTTLARVIGETAEALNDESLYLFI